MNALSTSIAAGSGVYFYVALYFGALSLLRRDQPEYRAFAGLSLGFGTYALSTAFSFDATETADAAGAQVWQFAGIMVAAGFFVDFILRIADVRHPRLVTFMYVFFGVGAGASLARLVFDPARANPAYTWSLGGPGNPATADLSIIGVGFAAGALIAGAYAIGRLFVAARTRRGLRLAAAVTTLGIAGGFVDLARSILDVPPWAVTAHSSLLILLGFSDVLIGRFTRVDVQLADRTEKLAQSYDSLRLAQEELVKKEQLAAVGELSAVIAHEVRNPLAIIKNAVGGLRRVELPPDDADTLFQILDEETDRLNRLVNDLLAYAKPIAPETGQVDMRKLVGHAVELAAGGNRDISQIEIELELDRQVASVEGDEALLRHALINIVDNALQAMPTGGTLTITCRDTEFGGVPSVAVDFHDTGEGMDTLVRSKARDPFFTTRQSGTGLGLAIVDRVARVHGGTVEIESRHGQGTTVSFIVPRERSSLVPASS